MIALELFCQQAKEVSIRRSPGQSAMQPWKTFPPGSPVPQPTGMPRFWLKCWLTDLPSAWKEPGQHSRQPTKRVRDPLHSLSAEDTEPIANALVEDQMPGLQLMHCISKGKASQGTQAAKSSVTNLVSTLFTTSPNQMMSAWEMP